MAKTSRKIRPQTPGGSSGTSPPLHGVRSSKACCWSRYVWRSPRSHVPPSAQWLPSDLQRWCCREASGAKMEGLGKHGQVLGPSCFKCSFIMVHLFLAFQQIPKLLFQEKRMVKTSTNWDCLVPVIHQTSHLKDTKISRRSSENRSPSSSVTTPCSTVGLKELYAREKVTLGAN